MEHDQSSYFCRGPAPVGPTLVTAVVLYLWVNICHIMEISLFKLNTTYVNYLRDIGK